MLDTMTESSDTASLLAYKGLAISAWVILLLVAERAIPAVARPGGRFGGWSRVGRNMVLFVINGVVSRFAVIPLTMLATTMTLGWRGEDTGGWTWLVFDILVLDLWIYWWHRANHGLPFLWRFHEVHHLDEFLDVSSAVRFHAGEVLMSACVRAVVIVALDIPLVSVLVFETLVLSAAIFQHSNLKIPARLERALSWVIVTPSIHWLHHHAVRADTDSNFATIFSVWDRLFGSRSPTPRTPDLAIGTEGRREKSLLGLLLRPLKSDG